MVFIFEWLAASLGQMIFFISACVLGYLVYRDIGAILGGGVASFLTAAGSLTSLIMREYGGLSHEYATNVLGVSAMTSLSFILLILFYLRKSPDLLYMNLRLRKPISKFLILLGILIICDSLSNMVGILFSYNIGVRYKFLEVGFIGRILWAIIIFIIIAAIENINPAKIGGNFKNSTAELRQFPRRDPYEVAGQEVVSGKVKPSVWARALVEGGNDDLSVKAHYVRLRVSELEISMATDRADEKANVLQLSTKYESQDIDRFEFSKGELSVYGGYQLYVLGRRLQEGHHGDLVAVAQAICRKIGRKWKKGQERSFLEAYCSQLRAHLGSEYDEEAQAREFARLGRGIW